MNYKPFDLQKALAGEPVVMRNGESVFDFFYYKKRHEMGYAPICVLDISGTVSWRDENGFRDEVDTEFDLFMAPKEVEYWVATAIDNTCPNMLACSDPKISTELAVRDIHRFTKIDADSIQTHKIIRYE